MYSSSRFIAGLFCMVFLAGTAHAQFLNDTANLKILKARAELLHQNGNNVTKDVRTGNLNSSGLSGQVSCGSVDIANQVTTGGIGQDISVIITGDIINTNNRCINAPAP